MKRIFTLLFAAMLAGQAWAQTTFTKNNLEYTVTDATNHYVSVGKAGTKPTGDLEIKDTVSYDGVIYTVTSIPSSGFYGCNKLTSITLPSTITSIGFESFYNCNQLTSFTIPSAVTSIGKYAFRACSSLTSINIPSGVSSIGDNAFESCSGLTAINVESDNATYCSIDGVLFKKKNTYLSLICYPSSKADTEYNLPDNVSSIENKAFYGCKFLASINVSNSNKDFYSDNGVLLDINKRTLIVYPSQKADTAYSIPNTVVIILYKAFYQCQNIKSLIIPKSVTDIDEYSIHNCTNLTVKCCAASKPEGWLEKWSYNVADVVWGYTPEETPGTKTWTVSLSANNSSYGSVSGGGTVKDGETTTITATPAEGYRFVKWSNGLTNATETITVTSDLTLVAEFEKTASTETWTVTLSANNDEYGSVSDGGTVKDGSTITITATPANGYYFVKWSNGLTNATETITVTSDLNLVAVFAEKVVSSVGDLKYEITSDSTAQVVKSDDYKTLTEVVIPETVEIGGKTYTVTYIGYDAFRYCTSLAILNIPKSVTGFDLNALYGCSGLTEINIDDENTTFSSVDGVLYNKNKTELIQYPENKSGSSYTIPSSVTDIHSGAFEYCPNLTSVSIPNSVKRIGNFAFMYCTSLTEITIPDGVTIIEGQTFEYCPSLSSVTIPQSVTKICNNAFEDCSSLKSITIPSSVIKIEPAAFRGCDNLTNMNLDGNKYYTFENQTLFNKDKTELIKYVNGVATGEYIIPNTVTRIGDDAFCQCHISSVIIPESVTSIGAWAFMRCWNLTSITIPNSVTELDDYAIEDCNSLESVILSESVKHIGYSNFSGCNKLTFNEFGGAYYIGTTDNPYYALIRVKSTDIESCEIHNNCKVIAEGAFGGCENLKYNEYDNVLYLGNTDNPYFMLVKAKSTDITSCEIGNGCRIIEKNAFYNCDKLTSISIPDGVKSIGNWAFDNCDNLADITIPESVESIGNGAFYDCDNLTTINIPKSVTSIGEYAFYYCTKLKSITIPDSLTAIGNSAFYSCRSLSSVIIPNGVTSIGNWAFSSCSNLAEITIPESVESIGEGAFVSCYNLTSLTISSGVRNIGERAFDGCNKLTTVTIPGSVTSIGSEAFDCDKASFYCEAQSKPEGWDGNWNPNNRPVVWGFDVSKKPLNVTLSANNKQYGSVSGGGITFEGYTTTIIAKPAYGYRFVKWSNGLTNATETITVTSDTTLVAEFADGHISHNGLYYLVTSDSTVEVAESEDYYNLASVVIPDTIMFGGKTYSVTSIGYEAFKFCDELKSVTIPNSVTQIGTWAFNCCYELESINIPNSVTKIGSRTFNYCYKLDSVILPNSITEIGYYAFWRCENLKTINISNSVATIDESAFSGCSGLTTVIIPNSVTAIRKNAFDDCSHATIYCEAESQPEGWNGDWNPDDRPVIWNFDISTRTYNVTLSANNNDYGSVRGGGITFEGYATTIIAQPASGYRFVKWSNGLSNATETITVTSDTVLVAEFADGHIAHNGLYYLVTSDSTVEVAKSEDYYNLTSVVIPDTIMVDGKSYSVTSIGYEAFEDCSELTSVTIPNTVKSIGSRAFYDCEKLASITIPEQVTTIGTSAFYACDELTSITIPKSVSKIETWAFDECDKLTEINVDSSNMYYSSENGVLFNKDKTELIRCPGGVTGTYTIPDGVTKIGFSAFNSCRDLTSVVIPNTVISIENYAFDNIGITSITIPNSVTSIGSDAFRYCSYLTSVVIPNSVTTIYGEAFYGCHSATIYCESNEKPTGWSNNWNYNWSGNVPVVWGFDPSMKIFNITLSVNNGWHGSVEGPRTASEGLTVTISAIPDEGCHFVKWSNGLTTATATITVTSDTTIVAEFAEDKKWIVSLLANNIEYGTVTKISGTNLDGSIYKAFATPKQGYNFVKWSNGLTTDTIAITLTSDTTLTAEFAEIVYAGTCGDNARWSYSVASKTLIISGTGSIDRYKTVNVFSSEVNRPWQEVADQIETVVVEEGITNLGSHAFCYCNNLKEVILSSTCVSYGGLTFANCPNLRKMVVMSSTYWQADEYCFSNYDSCMVYVPAGSVDYYKKDIIFGMFKNIVGTYMVIVDADIKNGTVEVESYTIPEGGTVTITPIPNEGYSIADVNFEGEYGYECHTIYIVNNQYSIENVRSDIVVKVEFSREDDSESGFAYKIISDNNIEITGYKGAGGDVTIPSTITDNGVEYTVTCIGNNAFNKSNNNDIESITIPNTVTNIGANAFASLYLTSLFIPNSVTEIGEDAFWMIKNIIYTGDAEGSPWGALTVNGYIDGKCIFADAEKTHLTAYISSRDSMEETINIPESVITIGANAFSNIGAKKYGNAYYIGTEENPYLILYHVGDYFIDSVITSFEVYGDCKYIYANAFANQYDLESVTIPSSVISIGEGAFYGCGKLTSVTIPDNVVKIGGGAFGNCSELESVTIEGNITSIDDNTFTGCINLISFNIPVSVTSIGAYAFYNCDKLELVVPRTVESIGESAFYDVRNVLYAGKAKGRPWGAMSGYLYGMIEEGDFIYYMAYGATRIKDVLLYTGNDSDVDIPDDVTGIRTYAFAGCDFISSVSIPSVQTVEHDAFAGCKDLTIYCGRKNTDWESEWLANNFTVVWGERPASVTETAASAVNIYAHGNTIIVENATDEIRVYDAMGKLVCRDAMNRDRAEITINGTGVYIVKVGGVATRVIVSD